MRRLDSSKAGNDFRGPVETLDKLKYKNYSVKIIVGLTVGFGVGVV